MHQQVSRPELRHPLPAMTSNILSRAPVLTSDLYLHPRCISKPQPERLSDKWAASHIKMDTMGFLRATLCVHQETKLLPCGKFNVSRLLKGTHYCPMFDIQVNVPLKLITRGISQKMAYFAECYKSWSIHRIFGAINLGSIFFFKSIYQLYCKHHPIW